MENENTMDVRESVKMYLTNRHPIYAEQNVTLEEGVGDETFSEIVDALFMTLRLADALCNRLGTKDVSRVNSIVQKLSAVAAEALDLWWSLPGNAQERGGVRDE